MAKQIKALKCPHCGSVKKQEIKDDHYICNNCGTEYFLDNDDINVNINHRYGGNKNTLDSLDPKHKKIILIGILGFLVFTLLPILSSTLFNEKSKSTNYVNTALKSRHTDYIQDFIVYKSSTKKQPVIMFLIERRYFNTENKNREYIIRFYDYIREKVIHEEILTNWTSDNYLRYRIFSNGKYYINGYKHNRIYQINTERNILDDVTDKLVGHVSEFASGIATIDFTSDKDGDGFKIMTNNGHEYFYYPLANKLYSDYSEFMKAQEGLSSLLPNATESIHYIFSEKSGDYPQEKIQLIKFWYKQNPGYPIELPFSHQVKWTKVYDYSNQSGSGSSLYEKKLFKDSRITKYLDLTPKRLYFDAKIVYYDSTNLYITGYPNANPESDPFIQKIDTKSGEVLWSHTEKNLGNNPLSNSKFHGFDGGLAYDYHAYDNNKRTRKIVIFGDDGKIIKELNKDTLFR